MKRVKEWLRGCGLALMAWVLVGIGTLTVPIESAEAATPPFLFVPLFLIGFDKANCSGFPVGVSDSAIAGIAWAITRGLKDGDMKSNTKSWVEPARIAGTEVFQAFLFCAGLTLFVWMCAFLTGGSGGLFRPVPVVVFVLLCGVVKFCILRYQSNRPESGPR